MFTPLRLKKREKNESENTQLLSRGINNRLKKIKIMKGVPRSSEVCI